MSINAWPSISWLVLAACFVSCGDGVETSGSRGGSGAPAKGHQGTVTASPTTIQNYATNFAGTEDPLSEDGAWSHMGLYWTTVMKKNGVAYGTQTGTKWQPRPNVYDDSYAKLRGFRANQKVSVVVRRAWWIDASCSHEFEILLRWSDDLHHARGYECNLQFNGSYQQIVRWNGPYGDYTVLASGSYRGLRDGDRFEASIIDNVITTYVNGTQILRITDNTYRTGNPGIGFFRGNCGSNTDVGISSLSATGIDGPVDAADETHAADERDAERSR